MKKEFKPLSWVCQIFDFNTQVIRNYDVLKYREECIREWKKKCQTKEEFAKKLRSEMFQQYNSRCEYELIIERTEDGHIWLNPWVGCREPAKVRVDVTYSEDYDWCGFAEQYINTKYSNNAKVDIFDQLTYSDQFEKLVDYCWYTRLKYERRDPKFDK